MEIKMLDGLSSFIELFAAVYVTMCFSDDLFKNFWAKDFLKYANPIFNSIALEDDISSSTIKEIKSSISESVKSIKYEAKRRGIFMLSCAVELLIYIGLVERDYPVAISVFCLCSFVPGLFPRLFKTIPVIFIWNIIICMISIVSALCIYSFVNCESINGIDLYVRVLVVVLMLAPVLCQLGINWLYSRVYHGYLTFWFIYEYALFHSAKNALKSRRTKDLPFSYKGVTIPDSKNQEDENWSDLIRRYAEHLKAIAVPQKRTLVCSWLAHKINVVGGRELRSIEKVKLDDTKSQAK